MALAFTTEKMASAQEAYSLQKLELLNATEALNSSWMDLTEAQREIDGLQEIMDNVHQSVEMLTKFGADAIPMLNADGGLEALLQIPERLITVEKAQEGLGEAAKKSLTTFWEWLKRIAGIVKDFFARLLGFQNKKVEEIEKVASASDDDVSKAAVEGLIGITVTEENKDKVSEALNEGAEAFDKLFDVETDAEQRLNAVKFFQDEMAKGLSEFDTELDKIDWDKVRDGLGLENDEDFDKCMEGIDDIVQEDAATKKIWDDIFNGIFEDEQKKRGSSGIPPHATESIDVNVNIIGNKLGAKVKSRCKSSKMKECVASNKKFDDAVIKFHSKVEVRIKDLETHPELLTKVQSVIRDVERRISKLSHMEGTLTKIATGSTSKVANKLH